MNNILQLKGQFHSQKNSRTPGPPTLPVKASVTAEHLKNLYKQLYEILKYWNSDKTINGALVSVYYNHVVAKSNRIKGLLYKGNSDPNDAIRGSKFYGDKPVQHVFTYYIKSEALEESINRLKICSDIVDKKYCGKISWEDIEQINKKNIKYNNKELAKSNFLKVIVDAYYVQKFTIDRDIDDAMEAAIVTIYKTDIKTTELLNKLGISTVDEKMIDETTFRLTPDELQLLKEKTPYLIAMKVYDLSKIPQQETTECDTSIVQIPAPQQEPIIGVIDTLFYPDVYFKEWVEYTNLVDKEIETTSQDAVHGTAVSSIIVDGPTINPDLDDGCGRFRVKHFGVATNTRFSSFRIIKTIREIVAQNREIKVWNLSLGSIREINSNFISPEGAELDRIQSEYDVIFVVAGTNKFENNSKKRFIGAPADSLNSIVVNAVDYKGNAASYHRVGPVLHFFNKPDISYFGGDINKKMRVCTPFGEGLVCGTSFAAPWVSRKMAYLIHHMSFTREVAKALLIDSAAGWNRKDDCSHSIGYGVVPTRIENILKIPSDEIRFILTASADAYETYAYNIPVPIYNNKQPFYARATLCYFPKASRNQGVDYTSTEMDIHFGRIKENKGRPNIVSINANIQGDEGVHLLREANARKLYRKWDNIKLISEEVKSKAKSKKVYGAGLWGISIKTKERLRSKNGQGLPFGVIVTLKNMDGENHIDDFIKLCMLRGWIVNEINIENRVEIYNKAEEELIFE